MKNLKLFLLLFFIPCLGFAQSLNGVYTGVLSNDSTTIRKDQSFEMALTEYNGKVYGYAYSTFIVNDTLYYIVKRVKGKIEGDICEVEDDEVITHNFPHKPDKKVFVTYTLRRNTTDSVWRLDGNWKTNLVKKRFYSISGKVETKEEKDLSKSKLYEHLGDLDLQKTLAFNKPKEKAPEKKPVKASEDKNDVVKNTVNKEEKKDIQQTETKPVDKKPDASVVKTETKVPDNKAASISANKQPDQNEKKDVFETNTTAVEKKSETNTVKADTKLTDNKTSSTAINNQSNPNEKKNVVATNSTPVDKKPEVPVAKPENKFSDNKPVVAVNNQPNQNEKKDVTATSTNPVEKPEVKSPDKKLTSGPVNSLPSQNEKKDVARGDKKSTEDKADAAYEFQDVKRKRQLKPAASLVDQRVSIPSETIYFKNDSLSIALYDNGEVDGDSVSVIINDEMFIEKQVLKSTAFRKTFYIPQDQGDSLLVVLFADNLGKYPPNTGLLQIKDGEEIFYVRFKADLDRNAAIVLRRKSK
ncbi:MAG TPA: hypothetical protein VFU29_10695 [Chitinophagaceae bacterium]|nr:hypothetical protein [Chitinophagaceae bacterium]